MQPLSKYAIVEIMYATKVHRKVFTMKDVTHMSKFLNRNYRPV